MDLDLNAGRPDTRAGGIAVIFATPSLTHQVALDFFRSYLDTATLLTAEGIAHGCIQVGGDPYLAKARNRLATDFLDDHPEATDLFFLDDDIGWPPEAALRLLRCDADVVAGIYPHKTDATSFPVELELEDEVLVERAGLFRAISVPTGFLRIRRHVLEELAADSPRYTDENGRSCIDIFRTGLDAQGRWCGEDYAFCQRWRATGGTIWVDPDITFTHSGRKRWTGNLAGTLAEWVRQNIPATEKAIA